MADAVVRGGTLVTPGGLIQADIRITEGCIAEIGRELSGAHEIDAHGLHVFPGLIDVHVHFNDPGRTGWEGAEAGSHALAAAGGTTFFDMPLNSSPCTVTAEAVDQKRAVLEARAIADFALWGGLTPASVGEMAEMAGRGVVGYKAFMCDSGLPEFPSVDAETLARGMAEAARLGLPVAVHAEDQQLTTRLTAAMRGSDAREFLASRPVTAEVAAIEQAVEIAAKTRARLHLVHVSSGSGVASAVQAKARGVDVSIETCPHYLYFTSDDLERIGVAAKCAPPLRTIGEQNDLWRAVLDGGVDIIASDHSPADPALKKAGDFRQSWGGIAGVQSTVAVLLNRGLNRRRLDFTRIASLLGANPAERFKIPNKGRVAVGQDADLMLLDSRRTYTLTTDQLLQRHKVSPYLGASFTGEVIRTIRRGETIFAGGTIVAKTRGKFIQPAVA